MPQFEHRRTLTFNTEKPHLSKEEEEKNQVY